MKRIIACGILLLNASILTCKVHVLQNIIYHIQHQGSWRQRALQRTAEAWKYLDAKKPQVSTLTQSLQEEKNIALDFRNQNQIKASNSYPLPEHILLFFIHQTQQKICPTLKVTPLFGAVPFIQAQASPLEVLLYLNEDILNTTELFERQFFRLPDSDMSSISLEDLIKVHVEYELHHSKQKSQFIEFILKQIIKCDEELLQDLTTAHIVQAAVNVISQASNEEQLKTWCLLSKSPFMPNDTKQILADNSLWQDVYKDIS